MTRGGIWDCCFSPNGRLIAVAAGSTAYVWDITSSEPHLVETFTSHMGTIISLAFSAPSSLISVSVDKSVKFWQIDAPDPAMTDSKPISHISTQIISITLQAKDGVTITSHLDGVVKTWNISTGLCKEFQTPARDFYLGDAQLINNKLVFVWYTDKINIWDVEKGEFLLTVNGPSKLEDIRISGDGSRIFLLDSESIQAWSIWTGEAMGKVKVMNLGYFSDPGFLTVDGPRVWMHYPTSDNYQGWDFGIPASSPIQLPSISTLHLNDALLWDTGLSTIKDESIGKVVFQLPKRFGWLSGVQWNGCYLAACFSHTEVLILDFTHAPFQ